MASQTTILLIDNDPDSVRAVETLRKQAGEAIKIEAIAANFGEGLGIIQKTNPMVVILRVDDLERGIKEVSYILSTYNYISIIVTAKNDTAEWVLGLMRAGAIEYLFHPLQPDALMGAIQKVDRLRSPVSEQSKPRGVIYTVYNPLGGMGTTTVAVNLATCFAAANSSKVALIDLNLFSGDVATFLNISPAYTLSSVTGNISRIDHSFIASVMTRHPSGMHVLTEPLEADEASDITPEQVGILLRFLNEMYSHVIIDTGGHIAGCNAAAFEASDYVLYNTVLNLTGLKNAKRYIDGLEKRGFRKEKVKLLVNRYIPRSQISIEDAERLLDWRTFHTIPNEYRNVVESINKGMPVVTLYPRSAVSKAIVALAGLLKK